MKNRDNEYGQGAILAEPFSAINDGEFSEPDSQTCERTSTGWSESEVRELKHGYGSWEGCYELDKPSVNTNRDAERGDD